MYVLTKSIRAAINNGSGTVPGAFISNIKLNLARPLWTTKAGTRWRSLKKTVSESRVIPSPKSYELHLEI